MDLALEKNLPLVSDFQVPENPLDQEEAAGHANGDFKTELSGEQKGPFRSGSRQGYFNRRQQLNVYREDAKEGKTENLGLKRP
jgi:hypothetical protein